MKRLVLPAFCGLFVLSTFSAAGTGPSKAKLEVFPQGIVMSDPREVRRVLISLQQADGSKLDLTGASKLTTTSDVVRIDESGVIHPVKDGVAVIEAAANGMTARFEVTVRGLSEKHPVGFVKDVVPILGKAGCNSGPCHGGAKGKNGFKLSLRGYDPAFDYGALIQDLSGRRFNRADPAQSLMLLSRQWVWRTAAGCGSL